MKSRLFSFLAGVLTVVVIGALTAPALASDGALTLTAHPVQVLVNGEVFRPKDSQGNDTLVFVSDGVTYAPVRALAEAYGLEVGYDDARNLVTVSSAPAKPASADFADQWTLKKKPVTDYGDEHIYTAIYSGSLGMSDFKAWWKSFDSAYIHGCAEQLAADAQSLEGGNVTMYFSYNGYALGTAYAFGDYEQSNFTAASIWIK